VLLHRQSLVARLQEALTRGAYKDGGSSPYQLVLCCAPAGYGKTTLLADFAHATSFPCCWYFLERADTDVVVFLRTLLASIRYTFPLLEISLDAFLQHAFHEYAAPDPHVYHAAITALCTALATEISERFAIILCNYEEIDGNETLRNLVNDLLQQLPPHVTLIIESRVMPDLSFAPLLARDRMCGITSDVLRFSAQDIQALAQLQGLPALTNAETEQLTASFEGWIAGILLGTRLGDARMLLSGQELSATSNPPFQMTSSAIQKRRQLLSYVLNEVLKQDDASSPFLQTVSILQVIEPALCNLLLGITDSAERLARLEHQGFITPYEHGSELSYICHTVIRDLLREQFRALDPERFCTLHRQAARYWSHSQNYEQAMYHACEGNDSPLQVQILLDARTALLHQGHLETLVRWLRTLPSALQDTHPHLLLIQATIALARGNYAVALPLLDKSAEFLATHTEAEEQTHLVQAEMEVLRGRAFYQAGEYAKAQRFCEHALQHLPEQEHALRAAAHMYLGICANLQGHFSVGITHLQQTRVLWGRDLPLKLAGDIASSLANTYYLSGNFLLAHHYLTQALETYEKIQDDEGNVNTLLLQGIIAQKQGASTDAETLLMRALERARALRYSRRGEAYTLANLGSLYLEQGKYLQALTSTEQGLALARTCGTRSLINTTLANLSLIHLFLGDPVSALLVVEQMEGGAKKEGNQGYERVWHDLTYGMILLRQGHYADATACLANIEVVVTTTHLQQGIFQAKMRLAACYAAQDRQEDALHLLKEVATRLAEQDHYTHLVRIEFQWLPELRPLMQNHRQLASLCRQLGLTEVTRQDEEQNASPARAPLARVNVPQLTIIAFGEPLVCIDGQPIKHWRKAKTMELFFFLLDRGYPASKETIHHALWPEKDEQITQSFHSALHYLRKLLGEQCIVFTGGAYSLNLAARYGEQISYDVRAFQQFRAEAVQAFAGEQEEHAKEAFLKMVHLYRGDYGRPFYSEWCTIRRDELRTAYVEARHQLAQLAWRAEAWHESAEHFRFMLGVDNCLEEAHYGLMRCYVRQGKRSAALQQYQLCREILQEELGAQPGLAIQTLYQRLIGK